MTAMLDEVLTPAGWNEMLPENGDAVRLFIRHGAPGTLLRIEERAGMAWVWIDDAEHGNSVIGIAANEQLRAGLEFVVSVQDTLNQEQWMPTYMALQNVCKPTIIAWEQFQRPFQNMIYPPADALARFFNDVLGKAYANPEEPLRWSVDLPELGPPSAWSALYAGGCDLKHVPEPTPTTQTVQIPNPRRPTAKVDFVIWAYDGDKPRPNGPKPDPAVAAEIVKIAETGFHLERWGAQAEPLGPQLASRWGDLLSLMAFAAPMPGAGDAFRWTCHVQIATALVISHLDSGWAGSRRRSLLFQLATGCADWSVSAAIIALGRLAKTSDEIRAEVVVLLEYLREQVPQVGFSSFAETLVGVRRQLGDLTNAGQWDALDLHTSRGGLSGDLPLVDNLDVFEYAEHRAAGKPPLPEWEKALARPDERAFFDEEFARSLRRQQMMQVHIADPRAMEIMSKPLSQMTSP